MARYESTFLGTEFSDFPEKTIKEIVEAKFLLEHGVVVTDNDLAVDADGNVLNEIGSMSIKIVMEV